MGDSASWRNTVGIAKTTIKHRQAARGIIGKCAQKTVDGGTHKVVKGETIHKIVTDTLKEQGIDEPTDEQIKKAKRALLEENAEAVQTYYGKKKEWHRSSLLKN